MDKLSNPIQKEQKETYLRDAVMVVLAGIAVWSGLAWAGKVFPPIVSELFPMIWQLILNSFQTNWVWLVPLSTLLLGTTTILTILILCAAYRFIARSENQRKKYAYLFVPAFLAHLITAINKQPDYFLALTSAVVGALIVALYFPPKPRKEENEDDELYRGFFAKKIVLHLENPNSNIRRIAILGPWGAGKTHLLKLIRQGLLKSKIDFRLSWVNPWKAESKEEAWGILASAFENATRVSWILPKKWHKNPWFRFLCSLMPGSSMGEDFVNAISSHYMESSRDSIDKIDKNIEKRKLRMVIFIDDMERADPDVVRGLLPVIDRLSEFKNCSFVFAIDPEQLQSAFLPNFNLSSTVEHTLTVSANQSESRHALESQSNVERMVTGFLDKVIDLQLELPESTNIEISNWAEGRIRKLKISCPKLSSSLSIIKPHLPLNPRICDKFLKIAEQTEVLFLCDYGQNEKDYATLFLILIAEAEFPGFRKALGRSIDIEKISEAMVLFSYDVKPDHPERKKLEEKIQECLRVTPTTVEEQRLTELIAVIFHRLTALRFGYHVSLYDIAWLTSGFLRRLQLPTSKMELVRSEWFKEAGNLCFSDILSKALADPAEHPSDLSSTFIQLLDAEVEEIEKNLLSAQKLQQLNETPKAELNVTLEKLEHIQKHFEKRKTILEDCEKSALSGKLLEKFVEIIPRVPIDNDWGDLWKDVRTSRITTMTAIEVAVPISERNADKLRPSYTDLVGIKDRKSRQLIGDELLEVRNRIKESIVKEFFDFLRSEKEIPIDYWHVEPGTSLRLLDPSCWVPEIQEEFDLSQFGSLIEEVKSNSTLHENLTNAVERKFLQPLIPRFARDSSIGHAVKNLITDKSRNREYVRAFWLAATGLNKHNVSVERLRNLRWELFEDPENDSIDQSLLNEAFPEPTIHDE